MPRRGPKAPGFEDGMSANSVVVVSGSIRTPDDADALKAHSSTPYFKEFFGLLKSLLDGAPEIEMYDEIARKRD